MQKSKKEAIAGFKKFFDQLSYSQDYSTTFSSFLDFALWRVAPHCSNEMKDELNRLDKSYDEKSVPAFIGMFDNWIIACDNEGDGFYDVLGDLFMECISFGRNGQFFTPQPICDMMAEMNYSSSLVPGQTVCDPACGSGRTLLAMAKQQRRLKFYGSDNDLTCVKMATLNLLINSMEGEIAWMDALSMEHYRSYKIKNVLIDNHYVPLLSIAAKGETDFIKRYKISEEKKLANVELPEKEDLKSNNKVQLTLNF